MNSLNWRKELTADKSINITVTLPDGRVVVESVSKFDPIIDLICNKYGLDPKNYRMKDKTHPQVKFTHVSNLADFEGNPYTPEEFENLVLKLKRRTLWNRLVGKGRVTRRGGPVRRKLTRKN